MLVSLQLDFNVPSTAHSQSEKQKKNMMMMTTTTTIMMMKVWHVIQLLTIDHAGVHPGCDGVDVNARLGHFPVIIRQRV